jgi:phage shock protein PspC (stress-responsive transcriptional regulator)
MSAPEFAEAQPARVSQPAVRTNGPPARAPGATADRKPAQTLPFGPLASSQRIWLGACTALADRFGIPADRVRIGFVVLGALTGPAALVAYLGWYWACYLDEHGPGAPRIDRSRLLRSIGETAAALASIAVVFAAAIWLVDRGHILIAGYPPDLAGSGAFAANFGAMIFVAAVITVPLSVLAGLPVAPPWDLTIPKSLRIVLGAFAALASLAFASYLSGAIVSLVQEWPA